MNHSIRTLSIVATVALCVSVAAPAFSNPDAQQVGNITYITGGVGADERASLESIKKDYNFTVLSANTAGELAGDTQIILKDRSDTELLNVTAGPLFLANLPAGSYTFEASNSGQVKTQRITISNSKPTHVHLSWK